MKPFNFIKYIKNNPLLKEEDENKQPTLQDIFNKKNSLDHLKGMRLKVIKGEYTKENPDRENTGCTFLFYDRRSNLVGVEFLSDKKTTNLYPKELVVDVEKYNAKE